VSCTCLIRLSASRGRAFRGLAAPDPDVALAEAHHATRIVNRRVIVAMFIVAAGCCGLGLSASGHKNKALENGKDIWMRYPLPTQHYR
jgi:hypothetical protein